MADNYGKSCPCCKTEWKVTKWGKNEWKDCLKCEDTAENIFKNMANSPKKDPTTKYKGADWLQDWADEYRGGVCPAVSNYSGSKYADEVDPDDWGDIPFIKVDLLYDVIKKYR